jgi:hypothetical protein
MVALMDLALGAGCACCNPFSGGPQELPDIVCHACKKVLYTARQSAAKETPVADTVDPLDLTPGP